MDLLANFWDEVLAQIVMMGTWFAVYRGWCPHWMSQMGRWTQTDFIIWGAVAVAYVRSAFTISRAR